VAEKIDNPENTELRTDRDPRENPPSTVDGMTRGEIRADIIDQASPGIEKAIADNEELVPDGPDSISGPDGIDRPEVEQPKKDIGIAFAPDLGDTSRSLRGREIPSGQRGVHREKTQEIFKDIGIEDADPNIGSVGFGPRGQELSESLGISREEKVEQFQDIGASSLEALEKSSWTDTTPDFPTLGISRSKVEPTFRDIGVSEAESKASANLSASQNQLDSGLPSLGISRPEVEETFRDIGVKEAQEDTKPDSPVEPSLGVERTKVEETFRDIGVSEAERHNRPDTEVELSLGIARTEIEETFRDLDTNLLPDTRPDTEATVSLGISRTETEESFIDIGVSEAEEFQGSKIFSPEERPNPDGVKRASVDPTWIDLGIEDAAKNQNASSESLVPLVERPNPLGISREELDPNYQDIGVSDASNEAFSGELHPTPNTAPSAVGDGEATTSHNDIYLRGMAISCFGVLTGTAKVGFPGSHRAAPAEWVRVSISDSFPQGYGVTQVYQFRWDHWQNAILPVLGHFEISSPLNKVRLRNREYESIIKELEVLLAISLREQGYLNIHVE
jgi:hypothetical protein